MISPHVRSAEETTESLGSKGPGRTQRRQAVRDCGVAAKSPSAESPKLRCTKLCLHVPVLERTNLNIPCFAQTVMSLSL